MVFAVYPANSLKRWFFEDSQS